MLKIIKMVLFNRYALWTPEQKLLPQSWKQRIVRECLCTRWHYESTSFELRSPNMSQHNMTTWFVKV